MQCFSNIVLAENNSDFDGIEITTEDEYPTASPNLDDIENRLEELHSADELNEVRKLPDLDKIWQFEERVPLETPVPAESIENEHLDVQIQSESVSLFQSEEEFDYYENDDGSVTIRASYYNHDMDSLIIPEKYHRRTVTRIEGLYEDYDEDYAIGIRSLTIPSTVREISGIDLGYLEEIIVDPNNTSFSAEDGVLFNYDKTELIQYPPKKQTKEYTFPNGIENIPDHCFSNSDIEKIIIPDSVKTIGTGAFEYCEKLSEVSLPNGLIEIGERAFYYCLSLKNISIPNGVTCISSYAFQCCQSLSDISLPDSLTELGTHTFSECQELQGVSIPKGISCIPDGAFSGCSNLTNVELPEGIYSIGGGAFSYTDKLSNIVFPMSLEYIDDSAFYCSGLNSIYITSNIHYLGEGVFSRCENLREVTFANNCSLSSVSRSCFSNCPISNINLPYSINIIESDAFFCCPMEEINLNNIEYIGDCAFEGHLASSIYIPYSVKEIGVSAFLGQNLREFAVDSNNSYFMAENNILYTKDKTRILQCAPKCGISTFVMPDTVTIFDERCFYGNGSLQEIELSQGITQIPREAFSGNYMLSIVKLPHTINKIEDEAFYNCSNLYEVNFEEGLESIGNKAFYDCFIRHIDLPTSLKYIGQDCFYSYEGIDLLTIHSNLQPIEEIYVYKWRPFNNIKYVELVDEATKLDANIFGIEYVSDSNELLYIKISDNINEIVDYIDYEGDSLLKNDNTVVYCNENSYASDWMSANDKECKYLSDIPVGKYQYSSASQYNDDTIEIYGVDDSEFAIANIPSEIDGKKVVRVNLADEYSSKIHTLILPEGVTYANIDIYALREVQLPKSLKTIEGFSQTFLERISLPDNIENIWSYSFNNNHLLNDIELSANLNSINDRCFNGNAFHSINIPNSLYSIGRGCFESGKLKSFTADIGGQFFTENGLLYSKDEYDGIKKLVAVPGGRNDLLKINYDDLDYSEGYSATLVIPDGVQSIKEYCFDGLNSEYDDRWPLCKIDTVEFPNGLKYIEDSAFYNVKMSTQLPDSLLSIGDYALSDWQDTNVTLPNSLVHLGGSVFCHSPIESIVVPNSVESLTGTFAGMKSLTNVKLPTNISIITSYMFAGCTSLENIVIPKSSYAVGRYAFRGCSKLSNVIFQGHPKEIDSNAFEGCTSLESISLPDGIEHIYSEAFENCTSLTSITIPNGVTSLGSQVFWNDMNLEKVILPNSINKIYDNAFSYYNSESKKNEILPNLILQVEPDSYAETYAKENGIPYNKVINNNKIPYIPEYKDNTLKGEVNSNSSSWQFKPYTINNIQEAQHMDELILKSGEYNTNDNNISVSGKIYVENATLNISSGSYVHADSIEIATNGVVNVDGYLSINGNVKVAGGKDNNSGGVINVNKKVGVLEDDFGVVSCTDFGIYDYGYVNVKGRIKTGNYTVKTSNNSSIYSSGGQLWINNNFKQKTNGALWFVTGKDNFRPSTNFDMILSYNPGQKQHKISFASPDQSMIGNLYVEVGADQSYPNTYSVDKVNRLVFGRNADIYKSSARTGYTIIKDSSELGEAAKIIKKMRQTMRQQMDKTYSFNIGSGIDQFSAETNRALNMYLYTYFMGVDLIAPSELKNLAAAGWYIVVPVTDNGRHYDVKFTIKETSSMGAKMMGVNYSINNSKPKHFATYGFASVNEFKDAINEYFKGEYKSAICKYLNLPIDDYVKNSKDMVLRLAWDGVKGLQINGSKKYVSDVIKAGIDVYWDKVSDSIKGKSSEFSPMSFNVTNVSSFENDEVMLLSNDDVEEKSMVDNGVIYFADDYLALAIRNYLGLNETDDISLALLSEVTSLNLADSYVTNISGLEYCTALQSLELQGNAISNISPLANIGTLEYLDLRSNNIQSVPNLSNLTSLQTLRISQNYIKEISGLAGLNITDLDISYNQVSDIKSLSTILNLSELDISYNQVSDISALEALDELTILRCASNNITDISKLRNKTLYLLDISDNIISDISVLDASELSSLYAGGNNITDISCAADWTGMVNLDLHANGISNIEPLASCTEINELNLAESNIESIDALQNMSRLDSLNLSYTNITDFSVLSHLKTLKTINLENVYVNDWSFLSQLQGLRNINLSGSNVHSCDLEQLYGFTGIKQIDISSTDVNNLDFSQLGSTIEILNISDTYIENIEYISNLSNLSVLNVSNIPTLNKEETSNILDKIAECATVIRNIDNPLLRDIYFQDDSITIAEGQTYTQPILTIPMEAAADELQWSSTDTSVATVSNGIITAHKAGKTTITAITADNQYMAEYELTVEKNMIHDVSVNGNVVSAIIENITEDNIAEMQAIMALYNDAGQLKELSTQEIQGLSTGKQKYIFKAFKTMESGDTIKIMVWDNINNMKPICNYPISRGI